MKLYIKFILSLFLAFTSCQPAFALTKVDGSLLKGDVIGGTASNTRRIVVPKDTKANLDAKTRLEANLVYGTDTKKAYIDNGTDLIAVGSGSGGAVNLITDGDAENATSSIFVPYLDSGSRPTDGVGLPGVSVTTALTSTAPLTGAKSFLLTKTAFNSQGNGWSIPFTVPLSMQAKVLQIEVDYIVNSGTFVAGSSSADSDVIWYLYDVTNSTLIEPSSIKLLSSSSALSDKFRSTFQTSATGTSYRLIAHVATTSALAYELKVDNISVSPSNYVYGTPITDWVSWTPTGSWTTNTTYTGKKRRVGDEYEYMVRVATSGAPTAAAMIIQIQETIDTTKLNTTTQYSTAFESSGQAYDSGNGHGVKVVYSSNPNQVALTTVVGPQSLVGHTTPFTFGAGDEINVRFTLPILGKSSSVQMSDSADTRVVAARYSLSANQSITDNSTTTVVWNTTANGGYDTHGAMNTTNGRYTFTSAGKFRFSATVGLASSISIVSGNRMTVAYRINGGSDKQLNFLPFSGTVTESPSISGSDAVDVNVGDYIEIRTYLDFGGASYNIGSTGGAVTYFSIEKIQGPQAIAASESVACSYSLTATQSAAHNVTTTIVFNNKVFDTHGAFNTSTGIFTAPIAGKYRVSARARASIGTGVSYTQQLVITTTGTGGGISDIGAVSPAGFSVLPTTTITETVSLNAGQTVKIDFYHFNSASAAVNIQTSSNISIERIGN